MFRVSLPGNDVKYSDGSQNAIDDRFPNLKKTLQGSGSLNVVVNGQWYDVVIPHGLGYIPMVQANANDGGTYFANYYWHMPSFDFVDETEIVWRVCADAANVYLGFLYKSYIGENVPNVLIRYNYRIYIDKGKL